MADPLIKTHLVSQLVHKGSSLRLGIEIDSAATGTPVFVWRLDNVVLPGEVHATLLREDATASAAGTYTVTVQRGGVSEASTAMVAVVDVGAAVEQPYRWNHDFAMLVGGCLAIALGVLVAPLVARGWRLQDDDGSTADVSLLSIAAAALGICLVAASAFAVLMEVRGRAREAGDPCAVQVGTIPPDGVARILDSLGRLRGATLLAAGGLISLGISATLGWRILQ